MPMPRSKEPDREVVRRVAQEEALRSKVTLTQILDMDVAPAAVAARVRCWKRTLEETGCGIPGLARAWGCDANPIRRALFPKPEAARSARPPSRPKPIYDQTTLDRLAWHYGPERAAAIAEGQDQATNLDLGRWQRLCGRAA